MRLTVVAGPPSVGKTSVLVHALHELARLASRDEGRGPRVGVVKFDCLTSDDVEAYHRGGIDAVAGFSAGQCPDHFFAANVPTVFDWARDRGIDLLVTESAGLCNRCSPYVTGVPAICVIDFLAGIGAPRKVGPLLRMADLVVLTKGDMVSQAEREVFAYRVQSLAPRARVIVANGLTGQGTAEVARALAQAPDLATLEEATLRFSTPSALCSYCLGERALGPAHQMGNTRRMELA